MASGKAVRAGRGFVELFADDKKLRVGLKGAETRLQSFGRRAKAAGQALGAFGAIAGTAAVGGILALAKQTAEAGDAIQKMGVRTGASAEFLSTMAFAAEQSGSDIKALGDALFRMNRRLGNATTETGPAVRALRELGLVATEIDKLNTEQKFFAIVRALSQVESPARRAQLAFELFGDQAKALIPLLDAGEDGIKAMQAEAVALGRQMSQENVDAAAAFNDEFNRLTSEVKSLGQELAFTLLPVLTKLIGKVREVNDLFIDWKETLIGLGLVGGQRVLDFAELFGEDVEEQRAALVRGAEDSLRELQQGRRRRAPGQLPAPAAPDPSSLEAPLDAINGAASGALTPELLDSATNLTPTESTRLEGKLDELIDVVRGIDASVTTGLQTS